MTECKLDKVDSFWRARYDDNGLSLEEATYFRDNKERFEYDMKFIDQYLTPESSVLDLGAGPLFMANFIAPRVRSVTCVEMQHLDFDKLKTEENIACVVEDACEFRVNDKFDLILIFGVLHHLTEAKAAAVYKNCYGMMHRDSVLIARSQYALEKDVYVDHFSDELKAHYQAHYRTLDNDRRCMNGLFKTEVSDIYPDAINRFSNTRNLHLVCTKNI